MVRKKTRRGIPEPAGEVLLEFQRLGNILRVAAIDPKTGTEVTMIADPRHSKAMIKRLAARKLAYVLNKKARQEAKDKEKNNLY